jgi:hypothetical protein
MCRRLGVLTPEDPFPVWDGPGGPAIVVLLFTSHDYSFRPDKAATDVTLALELHGPASATTVETPSYPKFGGPAATRRSIAAVS